jgi:hypothetical protein
MTPITMRTIQQRSQNNGMFFNYALSPQPASHPAIKANEVISSLTYSSVCESRRVVWVGGSVALLAGREDAAV